MAATATLQHREIEFVISTSHDDGFYTYEFIVGEMNKHGRKEARLFELAVRKVRLEIDRVLKHHHALRPGASWIEAPISVRPSSNAR